MIKGTESPKSRIQYLAGVLDSLGCIRIESLRKGERATLCLWVTSKSFEMMEAMQKFGAHVGRKSDGQYRAKWKDRKAYNILKQVVSYLTVRKGQARVAMEFQEQRASDELGANDQFYRMRLKLLKREEELGQ
jgi:hypothetical protein